MCAGAFFLLNLRLGAPLLFILNPRLWAGVVFSFALKSRLGVLASSF